MMEVRLQAQEDEITLLKSSLADALRRIHRHEKLLPLLKQQLIAGELLQHAIFTLQPYGTVNYTPSDVTGTFITLAVACKQYCLEAVP